MTKIVKHRRYPENIIVSTTGADGELIIDTTNKTLTVHDGVTAGGSKLLTKTELAATSGATKIGFSPTGTIAATTVQTAIAEINSDLAATGGAALVGTIQTGTGAVARTVDAKLNDVISIFDFFTTAQIASVKAYNSTEDVTVPIQTALNLGIPLNFPCGLYKITSGLQLKNGSKILGSGTWSGNDTEAFSLPLPLPLEFVGTTVIKYAGVAGANVAIINASVEAVGVEPKQSNSALPNYRNLSNVACTNVVLDGNSLAGIGLYIARGLTNNNFDNIAAIRTTEHAFLVLISWQGNVKNWFAVLNEKCGITLGRNVFSWASNNVTVDECIFTGLSANYSGTNASRVTLNQFNETTGYDLEYGIGFYQGRANLFLNTNTGRNGGAGLYLNVDRWPNKFLSMYSELNCLSTNATSDKYGIWFQGYAGHVSRHVHFESIYFGSTAPYDGIRLAGISPSRQGEDAVTFINVPLLNHLKSDWDNYILTQVSSDVVITGVSPFNNTTTQFPANIGIGGVAAAIINIHIPTEVTGGATAYGILHNGSVQQDVTETAYYVRATNTVAASTIPSASLTTLNSFTSTQGTFDASVAVGTQTGFFATSALSGATNNYGFRGSLVASGTSRYNLYMDGTAPNYFAGKLSIGTTTPATGTILDVQSTTGGIRFPNMTTTQKTAITPSAGTVVFDTTLNKLGVYQSSAWKTLSNNEDLALSTGATLVGTIQTGTGAFARTVDAKLKNTVSVWDFIPPGTSTGSVDCTAYIQAAIDSVGVNGTIRLPKGIYRCRGVNLTANKYLIGDGENSTKLRFFRSGNSVTDSTSYVINWTGSYGGIYDLTIDGQGSTSYDMSIGNGLFISPDSGGFHRIIKNVVVQWFAGYSATATGTYGTNANYSQAELQGVTGGNTIVISSASFASEIQFINVTAGHCDNIGIDLGTCNDSRMENVYIVGACKHGLYAKGVSNWHFNNIKVYLCRLLTPRDYIDEKIIPYTLGSPDTLAAVVLSGRGHSAVNFETQENGSHGFVFGVDQYELSTSTLKLFADGNGGQDPSASSATNITYRRYGVLASNFSNINLILNGIDFRARVGLARQSKAIYIDSIRQSYSSLSNIYCGAFYRIKSNTGADFTPLQYSLTTKSNAVGFVFCCTSVDGTPDPTTVFGTGSLEVVNGYSNFTLSVTNQTDQLDGIGVGYDIVSATGTNTLVVNGAVKTQSDNANIEMVSAKQAGDLYPRIALFSSGALRLGSGSSNVDVSLARLSSTSMGTASLNSFRTGSGVWNEGHLLMGAYHLWIDSNAQLRIKSSAPTSDTDGSTSTNLSASDNIGIGGTANTIVNLAIAAPITGGTTAYGILHNGAVQADVTATAYYIRTTNTVAPSVTLPSLNSFTATQGTFGSLSTVTNQTGFFATAALVGATNNFGFRGSLVAATGSYNLYMDGTAANYFAGDMRFSKTVTAIGTTGAVNIDRTCGTANFASYTTSSTLTVTNNLVTVNSIILVTIGTSGTGMTTVSAVAGTGSFVLTALGTTTATTRINFLVIN